jgi:hypothetical protein
MGDSVYGDIASGQAFDPSLAAIAEAPWPSVLAKRATTEVMILVDPADCFM